MRSNRLPYVTLLLVLISGCGGGGSSPPPNPTSGLVSIDINTATPSAAIGTTPQFTATGHYQDGSTRDITSSVTWSSGTTTVAGISNTTKGKANPVTVGTTTISASLGGVSAPPVALTVTPPAGGTNNVMRVTVNGALCSPDPSANYPNKPCVAVTICSPDNSNCQTINDILLDTMSYGLRIFKQALTVPLTQVAAPSGNALAECINFADRTALWGPVQRATVIMGNEPAFQVPVQVIDTSFGNPAVCPGSAQNSTSTAVGFTGVLGIGSLTHDCGPSCASVTIGQYFSCSGTTCTGTVVPAANQVQNPVALLQPDSNGIDDTNGVVVHLGSVPQPGAPSNEGQLILGIGTRANNAPANVTTIGTDSTADFTTTLTFNGVTQVYDSFLDTGSNGIFFNPPGSLTNLLPSPDGEWFYPVTGTGQPTFIELTATQNSAPGVPLQGSSTVPFEIGNFGSLFRNGNNVFNNTGGPFIDAVFDWGLPFFLGRSVFVGITGATSPLGTGPYVAYTPVQ